MAEVYLTKNLLGQLEGAHAGDREYIAGLSVGAIYKAQITKPRNYKFHKKVFALIGIAYDLWDYAPQEMTHKGMKITPQKNFEQFREWSIIQIGCYDVIGFPNGEVRIRAQSLAFHMKDQDQVEKVYSDLLDFYLNDFLKHHSRADIEKAVQQLIQFA